MWAGAYSLDLYCENDALNDGIHTYSEFPHQYVEELGSTCRAKARRDGWIVNSDGTAICPKCSGKKTKKKAIINESSGESSSADAVG